MMSSDNLSKGESQKRVAVVLSGCGNKDGAEITESVSAIIALSQSGASTSFFAPNIEFIPKNYITNESLKEKRNVLLEAARISRSNIQDLELMNPREFEALLLPGGFGAALHLSNWALKGAQGSVHPNLKIAIQEFYHQEKPIGAICIAPVILAMVLGSHRITITIGDDKSTIEEILKTGAKHEVCPPGDFVSDRENKILTTPAYMYPTTPRDVFKGVSLLVKELVEMA